MTIYRLSRPQSLILQNQLQTKNSCDAEVFQMLIIRIKQVLSKVEYIKFSVNYKTKMFGDIAHIYSST